MNNNHRKLFAVFAVVLAFSLQAFSQAAQEKSVVVFGAKINYIEAGDAAKPTVILLHGLGGSLANWATNTDRKSVV